jgi:Icc-related predicted phosphoesterase
MRVAFVGDTHGKFEILNQLYHVVKPDYIVQVGDFGYYPNMSFYRDASVSLRKIECPVYFCDGNHEDFGELGKLPEDGKVEGNVFYKKRGSSLTINHKNILFCGGANSIDKDMLTAGYDFFYEEIISCNDLNNVLAYHKPVTVMVSHTCPQVVMPFIKKCTSINYEEKDSSRIALDNVLDKFSPDMWFFGHWHFSGKTLINGTMFFALNKVDSYSGSYVVVDL